MTEEFHDGDILIIWLDVYHKEQSNNLTAIYNDLKNTNEYVKLFSDENECIDYITSITSKIHVFLILSPEIGAKSFIHELPQIKFIYIFYLNEINSDCNDIYKYVKKQNIFNDKNLLVEKIRRDVKQYFDDLLIHMTYFDNNGASLRNLSNENQYFMYMHIFLEILLRHSDNNEAKEDLLKECIKSYENNSVELKKIEEFRLDDISKTAIKWYTRDCFLYRLLNQAMRRQHYHTIYKFRYIIKKLYDQIKEVHNQELPRLKLISTVYRGQLIHKNELKKLETTNQIFISMNSFLSTTLYKKIALSFVLGANDKEILPVLFQISLNNTESNSILYAYIAKYSYHEGEKEVLFPIDCIFEKNSVEKCVKYDQTYYLVKLSVTDKFEQNNELKDLTSFMNREVSCYGDHLSSLGYLMKQMGDYKEAEYFFQLKATNLSEDHVDFVNSSLDIASIDEIKGNYTEALEKLKKALQIQLQSSSKDHRRITTIHSRIGMIYQCQGDYKEALYWHNEGIRTILEILPVDHPIAGKIYCNIANIYFKQGQYTEALNYYHRADGFIDILPENHQDIATICNNIAVIYLSQGKHPDALEYFKKNLAIKQKVLPAGHPDFATTYNNIGEVLSDQGNYDEALEYLEKALEIRLKNFDENHPDTALSYNNIGMAYFHQNDHIKALNCLEKALNIRQQVVPINHHEIGTILINIGQFYDHQHNYNRALTSYKNALDIFSASSVTNHPNIAVAYGGMGLVYEKQGKFDQALECYIKARDISLKFVPADHPKIGTIYHNIALVYFRQKKYDETLEYFNKELNIQLQSSLRNDLTIAMAYSDMATVYATQKQSSQALECCKQAIIYVSKSSHKIHRHIADIYHKIGMIYYNQHDYDSALDYLKNALDIQSKCFPKNDWKIADIYKNIADIYYDQDKHREGDDVYKEGCKIKLNLHLQNLPDISRTHESSEEFHKSFAEAVENCEELLEIQIHFLPVDHRMIANTRIKLGIIYKRQKNYTQAMEHYSTALRTQIRWLPKDDPDITLTYWYIGDLLATLAINRI